MGIESPIKSNNRVLSLLSCLMAPISLNWVSTYVSLPLDLASFEFTHRDQVEVKHLCSHNWEKAEPLDKNEVLNWPAFRWSPRISKNVLQAIRLSFIIDYNQKPRQSPGKFAGPKGKCLILWLIAFMIGINSLILYLTQCNWYQRSYKYFDFFFTINSKF